MKSVPLIVTLLYPRCCAAKVSHRELAHVVGSAIVRRLYHEDGCGAPGVAPALCQCDDVTGADASHKPASHPCWKTRILLPRNSSPPATTPACASPIDKGHGAALAIPTVPGLPQAGFPANKGSFFSVILPWDEMFRPEMSLPNGRAEKTRRSLSLGLPGPQAEGDPCRIEDA